MKSEVKKISFSKSGLAIRLSRLQAFENPKLKSEQYACDPEIAAEVIWRAHQLDGFRQKVSADLGCGTGLLGIGMLLLGAERVYFVDDDKAALETAKKNLKSAQSECFPMAGRAEFRLEDVRGFDKGVEIVMENPPFGTKVRHRDIEFLQKAFEIAPVVYSFHKTQTVGFLEKFAEKRDYRMTHRFDFSFPLKATQNHHKRRIFRIKVSCLRFEHPRG